MVEGGDHRDGGGHTKLRLTLIDPWASKHFSQEGKKAYNWVAFIFGSAHSYEMLLGKRIQNHFYLCLETS